MRDSQYRDGAWVEGETPRKESVSGRADGRATRRRPPRVQDRPMDDIIDFGRVILVVSGALSLAIGVRVVAGRLGVPTAGLLLVAAAVASDLFDRLNEPSSRSTTCNGSRRSP